MVENIGTDCGPALHALYGFFAYMAKNHNAEFMEFIDTLKEINQNSLNAVQQEITEYAEEYAELYAAVKKMCFFIAWPI